MKEENLVQNIKKIAPKHCDNCGMKYNMSDFKILKISDSGALIHLSCSKCGNTYVINAYTNSLGSGSQRMPLVLDLKTADEIEKFANMPGITKDDAIDLYNFLNENKVLNRIFLAKNASGNKSN